MGDNSKIGRRSYLAVESSFGGGATSGFKRPVNASLGLVPKGNFNEYRGEGNAYVDSVQPGDEWSEGDSGGALSFSEILYPLESACCATTPTALGSGAYERLYEPDLDAPQPIRTYAQRKGNTRLNYGWNAVHWSGFNVMASRKEASWGGAMRGQQLALPPGMPGSLTALENVIILPKDGDLFYSLVGLDDLEAGNGIQILRGFKFDFALDNLTEPVSPMNSAIDSYASIIQSEVDASGGVRIGADTNYQGAWAASTTYTLGQIRTRLTGTHVYVFKVTTAGTSGASEPTWPSTLGGTVVDGTVTWTAVEPDFNDPLSLGMMRRGQGIALRYQNIGPAIGGGHNYKLVIDMFGAIRDVPGLEQEGSLEVNQWPLRLVPDPQSGLPWRIRLINKVAAL